MTILHHIMHELMTKNRHVQREEQNCVYLYKKIISGGFTFKGLEKCNVTAASLPPVTAQL